MEDNIYSRVITRKGPDSPEKDLVNSYRFKSSSLNRLRHWSPRLGEEDRFKKKRMREDEYIRNIEPTHRPVMVVKKKQVFDKLASPGLGLNPARDERYYKRTENTQLVDDVNHEISTQSTTMNRGTIFVHGKTPVESEDEAKMFKIQGVEFLPEGFLELDPLLYKDEYVFDNKMVERMFDAEQRRTKALRRKQFMQRDRQKMRDVTIFVIDEYKDKILEYFERWYFIHKRRMDAEELAHTAELLNCPVALVAQLQDVYLKRQRLANERKIRDYMEDTTIPRERKISKLPVSLQKYFANYRPGKARSRSPGGDGSSRLASSPSQVIFDQYEQQIDNLINEIKERNKSNPDHLRSLVIGTQELGPASLKKSMSRPTVRSVSPSLSRSASTPQVAKTSAPHDPEPRKVMILGRNPEGTFAVVHKLKPTLVGNELFFQQVEQIQSYRTSEIYLLTKDDTGEERARQPLEVLAERYENKVVAEEGQGPVRKVTVAVLDDKGDTVAVQKHKTSAVNQLLETDFETREELTDRHGRKTTVAVQNTGEETTTATRVRPTLVGGQYVSQVVTETFDGRKTTAHIVSFDEEGTLLSKVEIPPDKLSRTYSSAVVNERFDGGVREFEVETRNEKNVVVARQTMRPTITGELAGNLYTDLIEEVIDSMGVKRITVYRVSHDNRAQIIMQSIVQPDQVSTKKSTRALSAEEEFRRALADANRGTAVEQNGRSSAAKKATMQRTDSTPTFGQPESDAQDRLGSNAGSKKSKQLLESQAFGESQAGDAFKRSTHGQSLQYKNSGNLQTTMEFEETSGADQSEARMTESQRQLQRALTEAQQFEANNMRMKKESAAAQNRKATEQEQKKTIRRSPEQIFAIDEQVRKASNRPPAEVSPDDLLKESIQLNTKLEDYIRTLRETRSQPPVQTDPAFWDKIRQVFREEMQKTSADLLQKLNRQSLSRSTFSDNLLEEFYEFCRTRLPTDQDYKESVLFTSLFYYFLEKKKENAHLK